MKQLKLIIPVFLFILIAFSVSAVNDSDKDGIVNEYDACPDTNPESGLPNADSNPNLLGCSCRQLKELYPCREWICIATKPFEYRETGVSSIKVECQADYCEENTLYDFPESGFPVCEDNKPKEGYCQPDIISDSQLCIDGIIGPKESTNNQEIIEPETENTDYVSESFNLISRKNMLRTYLDNPSREEFQEKIVDVLSNSEINKNIRENTIQGLSAPYVDISINALTGKTLKNVVLVEFIDPTIDMDNIVFIDKPDIIDEHIAIWVYDYIDEEGIKISYRVNTKQPYESVLLVAGDSNKRSIFADWWPLLIIPIVGFLAYWYIIKKKT